MTIINLTPHILNIHTANGIVEVAPSGNVARVDVTYEASGEVAGIPVSKAVYGNVEGLPEPVEGTIYVVSGMVQARCSDRHDVYAPGNLVRDENGRPIGCQGLKQ